MAKSLRIAGQNWADSAVVTASSSVATLPPDRVQSGDIADVWRAGSTTAWLLADLGMSRTIGVIAGISSNAGLSDAVQFRVSTSDATGAAGDAYNSGTIATAVDTRYPRLVHFVEPAVSGRYVRIDFVQASAPEIGKLEIARTWGPSRHFSFGWEPLSRDWSTGTMSIGLNLHKDLRATQEGMRFILNGLTEAEFEDEIRELNRVNGTSREVLVCRNIDADILGAVTFWGEMGQSIRPRHLSRSGDEQLYVAEFEIWNRL